MYLFENFIPIMTDYAENNSDTFLSGDSIAVSEWVSRV